MATPDLSGNVQTTATNPAAAAADGQSVSAQPVDAVIQADRYIAAKAARGNKRRGMMFSKIVPAGNPADQQGTATGGSSFGSPGCGC